VQIQVKVDGNTVPFTFDEGSHTVTASVPLTEGEHSIAIVVRNECGSNQLSWKVTRTVCRPPVVTITSNSTPNNSTVTSDGFNLSGTVSNVANEADIKVTHNGQVIAFVYNQQTGVI